LKDQTSKSAKTKQITIRHPAPHSEIQAFLFSAFFFTHVREIWCCCGTKFGKANSIYELIATPTGWKLFRDIKEGDYVFDEKGDPTLVTFVTAIMYDHDCYEITFSDNATVVCDGDHLWFTETHSDRKNKARNSSYVSKNPVKTTKEILESLNHWNGEISRPNHSIPLVSYPVKFNHQDLMIDPYVLGLWLGDGSRYGGSFTTNDDEIIKEIVKKGFHVEKNKEEYIYCIHGLEGLLKKYDLIKNKHIPYPYLVGSPYQRLQLIQGLMDTDGTISKNGHCCFDNTNLSIINGFESLLTSFGIKFKTGHRIGKLYGKEHKLCYRTTFSTEWPVFKLSRKFKRIRPVSSKATNRYIVSIRKVDSVPVKCIKVQNESHLYLIGSSLIPTHNTLGATISQAMYGITKPGTKHRWVAPIYSQTRQPLEYFQKVLPKPPHSKRNKAENSIVLPKINTRFEFWHSQNPSSLEGDGIHSYVFDEAARQSQDIHASARTTVTKTKGPMIFISYPFGKNWFYDGCMEAKSHMEWSQKNGLPPEKIFFHARTIDNPTIDKQVIENARRELSSRQFRQFYLAEFLEDGLVFSDYTKCIYTDKLDVYGDVQQWYYEGYKDCHVVIGADWAKTNDYTVFLAIDMAHCRVVGFMRFHKRNYTEQVRTLGLFCRKFKTIEMVLHDKTGVGIAIDEQIAYLGIPYRGITLTNELKNEFVLKLCTGFEQSQIKIPYWSEMISELKTYEGKPNKIGTVSYNATSGKHDDIVVALFLAYYGFILYMDSKFEVCFLEDIARDKRDPTDLEKFYLDISEEDDFD
jgi:hypothetical protein